MYQKDGRIKKYDDAWTDKGREYYKSLVGDYTHIWSDTTYISDLVKHWCTYKSKYHRKSYKRKISSVLADEEEEEWSDSDLLVEEGEPYVFPEEHTTAEDNLAVHIAV